MSRKRKSESALLDPLMVHFQSRKTIGYVCTYGEKSFQSKLSYRILPVRELNNKLTK